MSRYEVTIITKEGYVWCGIVFASTSCGALEKAKVKYAKFVLNLSSRMLKQYMIDGLMGSVESIRVKKERL